MTVKQRNKEMGQIAVQLLFAKFESQKPSQGFLLPTRRIKRESVTNIRHKEP